MQNIINAQLAVALPGGDALPTDIQWMPPGTHTIVASKGGKPATLTVKVDAGVAQRMNMSLQLMRAKAALGSEDLPYFDFNHDDAEASAHPTEFYWAGNDPKTGGVRAKVEWTAQGQQAVTGKTYRRFSPTFTLLTSGDVDAAGVNMGGLVNRAAFKNIAAITAGAPASQGANDFVNAIPDFWWNYVDERNRIEQQHAADTQALKDQVAATRKADPNSPEIQTLERQIADADAECGQAVMDAFKRLAQQDPKGFKEFVQWAEAAQTGAAQSLLEQVAAKDHLADLSRSSNEFYAFYCAAHGYGNSKKLEIKAASPREFPLMHGAQALARRDGIDIADAAVVLAKHSPELYEQYREHLYRARPSDLIMETLSAHAVVVAKCVPFQAELIKAQEASVSKAKVETLETREADAYDAWRKTHLLKD